MNAEFPQIQEQQLESDLAVINYEQAIHVSEASRAPGHSLRNKLLSVLTASALVAGGVTTAEFATAGEAHAASTIYSDLGYPWASAPCEFGSTGGANCANPNNPKYDMYDWGEYVNGAFQPYRDGGYEYRNCTDYVKWKESTIGVAVPNLGNGGDWYNNAPASERTTTPQAGDAAVRPTTSTDQFGHVAYVESVNADGTITVSEYNHDAHGDGDTRTDTPADMGFTEFVNFGTHPSPGGGAPAGSSGSDSTQEIVNHAGEVWARSGVGTDWIREANAGSAAKVASGGGVQALIDDAGEVWARSGIGTDWTPESNQYSATEISVGSDGTQMIESYDGSVYAKRGVDWGGWVPEANPGSAADVETNGGLQVIRDGAGQLWVKGNSLDWGGFWPETGQYSALQVAISNDGTQMLRSYDGSVYGRANTAGSNWLIEANPGSAAEIAIGNNVQMLVDGAGQVWQKGPSIDENGWAAETNPGSAKNIAIVEDGTQLIQDNGDQLWARSTAANSTFTWETSPGSVASLGQ